MKILDLNESDLYLYDRLKKDFKNCNTPFKRTKFLPLFNDTEVDYLWFRTYASDLDTVLQNSELLNKVFVRYIPAQVSNNNIKDPLVDVQILRSFSR